MKLKFIDSAALDKNLKATVHNTGKIGFTKDAAGKLGLGEAKSARIAVNDEDPGDTSLYVIIEDRVVDGAFKVNKAGQYFYISTKALFDGLGMDYVKNNYVYDIVKTNIDELEVWKFKRRPIKGKGTNNPPTPESNG